MSILRKKDSFELSKVFTPNAAAGVSYVVRDSVEKKLRKALDIQGKQVVLYGHSGSGKTTVLKHIIEEKSLQVITSRCTQISTIQSIMTDAFDQLDVYYTEISTKSTKNGSISAIGSDYLPIKANKEANSEKSSERQQKRIISPQLTIQNLARLIGKSGAIWVIEDYHKISDTEKPKISEMMKLFMDEANDYPQLKIVVLGVADRGHEIVKYDSDLNNRVAEIEVPLLSSEEINEIIKKGSSALNIQISDLVSNKIADDSNGLAAIAHSLGYNLCALNNIMRTQKTKVVIPDEAIDKAEREFVEEKQDTYNDLYLRITNSKRGKYPNVKLILKALLFLGDGATHHDLLEEIRRNEPGYRQSNLSTYLSSLSSSKKEEVLRENSGRYSFADPFFKSYLKMTGVK